MTQSLERASNLIRSEISLSIAKEYKNAADGTRSDEYKYRRGLERAAEIIEDMITKDRVLSGGEVA